MAVPMTMIMIMRMAGMIMVVMSVVIVAQF